MVRSIANKVVLVAAVLSIGIGASATQAQGTRMNVLSSKDAKSGWKLLFDGTDTKGWRNYKKIDVGPGWYVKDGILTRTADTTVAAGDLVTLDKYRDFDLALDWRISEGGNSGIMYRVTEDNDYPWQSGPEMQILDDKRHSDGKLLLTSAGSVFAVYPSRRGVVKPAGVWNAAEIIVRGNHVEHWLNGKKLVSYELGSPDWAARVAASKFKTMPNYGKSPDGYIVLQDHGDKVEFRNIRVKVLP
jgi:hypothetical protein